MRRLVWLVVMAASGCASLFAVGGYTRVVADPACPVHSSIKCIGDLNSDGKPDLIVAGADGNIVWYTNPTWLKRTITTGGGGESGSAADDIDGDGDIDVVVGRDWYENINNGTSWIAHHLSDEVQNHDICIADMNGDGKKDIIYRGEEFDPVTIFLQGATPTTWSFFEIPINLGSGFHNGLDVADIDNDGKLDFAVHGLWGKNPGGNIATTPWPKYNFANWNTVAYVKIIDMDGDGRKDIVMSVSEATGNLSWFKAPVDPTANGWVEHPIATNLIKVHALVVADVDNDGLLDVTSSESDETGRLTIYYNHGTSWQPVTLGNDQLHNIRGADLNGDGHTDFFGVHSAATGNYPAVVYLSDQSPLAAPTLVSPLNGSTNQPLTVTLAWHADSGATGYHAQLATDSLFTSLVVNDSTLVDTSRQVNSLLPSKKYYWRVRARNAGGTSSFSSLWNFRTLTLPPVAPTLASPANGSTNQFTNLNFRWRAAAFATGYRLQLATDSLFTSLILNDSTLTDTTRTAILPGSTTIFWRVQANNTGGASPFSAAWSLTTAAQVTGHYGVSGGWNIVSVPLSVNDYRKTTLFPTAVSSATGFTLGTGYATEDTLANGAAYWLKFGGADSVIITGVSFATDSIAVSAGWNFIGPFSSAVPVASIVQVPPGIVLSSFYGYNTGYASSTTLQPGKGYWVKCGGTGYLVLTSEVQLIPGR